MQQPVISATGVFTPPNIISNAELVASFNHYADHFNQKHKAQIETGDIAAIPYSDVDFIENASGIKQRYVMDKVGVLDPNIMHPILPARRNDAPSVMAEMAITAAKTALEQANITPNQVDLVICAASNHERAYPAIAVEIQSLLGASGFAFDMNVACASGAFGIQSAADMIRAGSIRRALVVSPEICSAHLEWRDRDCHFIFGDACAAVVLETTQTVTMPHFEVLSTRCATQFSNNIRNNAGFLRRTREGNTMHDRRDMQFMQEGRKVFKEVLPIVYRHIAGHLADANCPASQLKRIWLHQANKTMNDFVAQKVYGRTPSAQEQPNILQDYANTSSAGSIIAFNKHSNDLKYNDHGLICAFGAGYSVGSVLLKRIE